jgi:hypothetical protein
VWDRLGLDEAFRISEVKSLDGEVCSSTAQYVRRWAELALRSTAEAHVESERAAMHDVVQTLVGWSLSLWTSAGLVVPLSSGDRFQHDAGICAFQTILAIFRNTRGTC